LISGGNIAGDDEKPPDAQEGGNNVFCDAVGEFGLQIVGNFFVRLARHGNTASGGDFLQSGGDVDAVAEDVIAVNDHFTDVDADLQQRAPVFGQGGIALNHAFLHGDGGLDRRHHGAVFDQQTIARGARHAAAMAGDGRVPQFSPVRPYGL